MKIILASQSPRRRLLLEQMGLEKFTVHPARGEESAPAGLSPQDLVMALAEQKAAEVFTQSGQQALVIGADTVVAIDGEILGKPQDEAQAAQMLRTLSGREHRVYTGVCVMAPNVRQTEFEETLVRFRPLSAREIARYIATGEPMDKAGAYGVQGLGCLFVEGIQGDYFNVVGLPVCRLGQMLARMGIDPLAVK